MRYLTLLLMLVGVPLSAQTRQDTLHLRDAVTAWARVRSVSSNSAGLKDLATAKIAAESLLFRSKIPVTPPPPPSTNTAPIASFSRSCASATRLCSVNASASTDDNGITSYAWQWGDGQSGIGVTATHVYPSAGSYAIRLTVTDAAGLTASTAQTISLAVQTSDTATVPGPIVVPPAPVATFAPLLPIPPPTVTEITALGGTFARYENDFVVNDDRLWAAATAQTAQPLWEYSNLNYYDRVAIYETRYARTGDTKYRDRARTLAQSYINAYVLPNRGNLPFNEIMGLGVAMYALESADANAIKAVRQLAERSAYEISVDPYGYMSRNTDCRILAYTLRAVRLAYLLGIQSDGQSGFGQYPDWRIVMARSLQLIRAAREADGQWRLARGKDAAGNVIVTASHPFTIGLLHDELVQYYQTVAKDTSVISMVKTSADILWRDDWVPAGVSYPDPYSPGATKVSVGGFKYVGKLGTSEGGTYPAEDLNGLIVNGYAWLWSVTDDATYKTKARAIFDGGVASGGATGDGKHNNQIYSSSQRALVWLR
jgi:hypothetical protein